MLEHGQLKSHVRVSNMRHFCLKLTCEKDLLLGLWTRGLNQVQCIPCVYTVWTNLNVIFEVRAKRYSWVFGLVDISIEFKNDFVNIVKFSEAVDRFLRGL